MPNNIETDTMHSVIVNMIHEALVTMQENKKVDIDKLDILSGLIFEHIFHRTHNFVSDELNEFREHTPKLKKHQEYIEWSAPIISSSDKIIRKLKQIGVIFSILFTLAVIGNQIYGIAKNYFKFELSITPISSHANYDNSSISSIKESNEVSPKN